MLWKEMTPFLTPAVVFLGLLAFASTARADKVWMKIGPGPTLEYANAYCDNASMGVQQGYFVYGSPEYVAGYQLGAAIGGAIKRSRYFHNCMAMAGWKKVDDPTQRKKRAKTNWNVGSRNN